MYRRYFYCYADMKVYTENEMNKGKLPECRYEYLGSFSCRYLAEVFADLHGFSVIFEKEGK